MRGEIQTFQDFQLVFWSQFNFCFFSDEWEGEINEGILVERAFGGRSGRRRGTRQQVFERAEDEDKLEG
jgi:hypothetical protein